MFPSPPILLFLLFSPAPAPPPDANGLIPLKIEPAPIVFDLRVDDKILRNPNIDRPNSKSKPIMVPVGTVNLAKDMTVTSSDKDPVIGQLGLITDGQNFGTDGSWIELRNGLQWVQIDLKESCPIYAVALWHDSADYRVYHDVIIQTCDRPDFDRDVKTLFNNDADNSAHLGKGSDREYLETRFGKEIAVKATRARYVRLYSAGSTADELNHYTEVAVYGQRTTTPAQSPPSRTRPATSPSPP